MADTAIESLNSRIAALVAEAAATRQHAAKPALPWLDATHMPPLRWITGEPVPAVALNYMIHFQQRSQQKSELSERAAQVVPLIDHTTSGDFALALFNGWLARGANAKESWLLPLACALADERVVIPLRQKIDEWANATRLVLAAQAVATLPWINSDAALAEVDAIANHSKKNSIRRAAQEAFFWAAVRLDTSEEELSDRVAPRLGFDTRGERVFDYGPRQFVVRLGLDQTLRDSAGKRLSALPKPGAHDDAVQAVAAVAAWKLLKSQLSHAVKMQGHRLENALIAQRAWSVARWRELFITHPLLRTFAISLVWGLLPPGHSGYQTLFRPLEDGTLTSTRDETVALPTEGQLRLVHPIELDDEQRAAWQHHLADYEITQPFPQINRPVLRPDPDEREQTAWEKYRGYLANGGAIKTRYLKAGWQRGPIGDNGFYDDIWKTFPAAGIEAFLETTGLHVGGEQLFDACMLRLTFLHDEAIKGGGTISYFKQTDPRILKLGEVPPLIFSEAAGDVQTFFSSGQYDENWKVKSSYYGN